MSWPPQGSGAKTFFIWGSGSTLYIGRLLLKNQQTKLKTFSALLLLVVFVKWLIPRPEGRVAKRFISQYPLLPVTSGAGIPNSSVVD